MVNPNKKAGLSDRLFCGSAPALRQGFRMRGRVQLFRSACHEFDCSTQIGIGRL